MGDDLTGPVENKYEGLQEIVRESASAAVAVSGGVDSTLLARVVHDTLGKDKMLAVFVSTSLLTADEKDNVRALIKEIGCRLAVVDIDPLAWSDFIANPIDRCYLCKKKVFSLIKEEIKDKGISVLMDGTNLDDLSDYRPGLKACAELGVLSPLVDAGLSKAEIRQLSRELGLANWNRPSASCLATRIPTGTVITRELLALVASGEEHLQQLGFYGCRVRLSGMTALVELAAGDVDRFVRNVDRVALAEFFADLGIDKVYLDIEERRH